MLPQTWQLQPVDTDKVSALQESLKIHPALCRLLVLRGVESFEEAKDFFRPELAQLHDPFLMRDMDKAINRLTQAIASNERILIYGDYDVDGTTSVAVVYSFLRKFYPNIDFYIPNRNTEGYGISFAGIDYAAQTNCALIIALDCGIKANDKVAYATDKYKIDFIICDHHLPGETIPNAIAVLDPKRNDCLYPYKELSGCGVGFKLIQAFALQQNIGMENCYEYLDMVCISIASDIVPITHENRILAYFGLKKINENPSKGIQSLIAVSKTSRALDIGDLVFLLGPRINAAGRMDDARHAVRVLISEEELDANVHAEKLQQFNNERKDVDRKITEDALEMIGADEELIRKNTTVVFRSDWNKGVIGIAASRLMETYYRPTIVLTESEGKIVGSARSVKTFDLYEAVAACSNLLLQYGGHKFAAGLTMEKENLPLFIAKFEQVVSASITPEQLIPILPIDAELELPDITPSFYNILQQFAPFGPGNMTPIFVTKKVADTGYSKLVKEQHLKLSIRKNNSQTISGIGFGLGFKEAIIKAPVFDVCYQLQENEWQGNTSIQLLVKDIKSVSAD